MNMIHISHSFTWLYVLTKHILIKNVFAFRKGIRPVKDYVLLSSFYFNSYPINYPIKIFEYRSQQSGSLSEKGWELLLYTVTASIYKTFPIDANGS